LDVLVLAVLLFLIVIRKLTNQIKETLIMKQRVHFAVSFSYAEVSACQEIVIGIHAQNPKTYGR